MAERIIQTNCPGVGEYYDSNAKLTKHGIRLFRNVEAVPVTLREDQDGVISVRCPFFGKHGSCERYAADNCALFFRDAKHGLSILGPTCRYTPASSHQSFEVYDYPFDSPHYYQRAWESLSPAAKSTAAHLSTYDLATINENSVKAVCKLWHYSEDPEQALEELLEGGVFERLTPQESLRAELEKSGVDVGELDKRASSEKLMELYTQTAEEIIVATQADLLETIGEDVPSIRFAVESKRTAMFARHTQFTPGFHRFLSQFRDTSGFNIDFTKPRDPEYYIDE